MITWNHIRIASAVTAVVGLLFMGNSAGADEVTQGEGKPASLELPESRSFHMGFTTWSMDFTAWGGASGQTIERMYKSIAKHADMIAFHGET